MREDAIPVFFSADGSSYSQHPSLSDGSGPSSGDVGCGYAPVSCHKHARRCSTSPIENDSAIR